MEVFEIKQSIKKAFWDVDYTAEQLYDVLINKPTAIYLTKERLYLRLIETYSWYKIREIVPNEQLPELLSESIIRKIRSAQLRKRYESLAELLRKFTLSASR